ncbi:MAG: SpoVG family protein [Candidatus Omnitrophota bacterium]
MIEVARVYKLDNGSKSLKAFADVMIDEAFVIKGVRIIEGKNGLFVAMPKSEGKDGKWYDIVKILNDDVKQKFQDTVLAAYSA